jgi:hypothetical protein
MFLFAVPAAGRTRSRRSEISKAIDEVMSTKPSRSGARRFKVRTRAEAIGAAESNQSLAGSWRRRR